MNPEKLQTIDRKKAEIKPTERKSMTLKPMVPVEIAPEKSNRELRQERREQRINDQIKTETGAYGINLSQLSKVPLTDSSKKNITNQVKQIASEEFANDIDNFSKAYVYPSLDPVPELNEEELKKSARRQRIAKWADALSAFGKGLSGRPVNPENFASTRLQRDRDAQYQNYKTATERNRRIQEIRDNKYLDDLLNFVQEKQKETTLSAAEKEKYRLLEEQIKASNRKTALGESQLAARRDNSYYDTRKKTARANQKPVYTQQNEDGSWQLSSGKTPYTDLLYSMTNNPDALFPDPGNRRYTTAEKEDMAKQIISQGFTISTDKNGNAVAVPIQGKENYIEQLPVQRQIEQLDKTIKQAEKDLTIRQQKYDMSSRKDREINKSKLDFAQKKLSELKQQRNSLRPNPKKEQAGDYDDTRSQEYNSFWNGTKKRSTFSEIVQKHQPQPDTIQTNEKLDAFFGN